MSAPAFYHQTLTAEPNNSPRRRADGSSPDEGYVTAGGTARRFRWAGVAGAILIVLAALAYAVDRLVARTTETLTAIGHGNLDGIPWVPVLLIGALLGLRVAFKAGQYWRGYQHARGIRRSHWSAIRGEKH